MPTTRESILQSLHALLQTLLATALRGEVLPERVPTEGLMILRDGDPGDPEVLLSPLLYLYDHRAEIEVVVQAGDPPTRDAALDTLLANISAALAADRTLGGLCDWIEPEAPKPVEVVQQAVTDTQSVIQPLIPYLDTLRWVFIALALIGVTITIYARWDDRRKGRR